MSEMLSLLLRIDWVAVGLFALAVACLCFIGWFFALFAEEITAEDMPPPIPPTVTGLDHPQRRKHDRANR